MDARTPQDLRTLALEAEEQDAWGDALRLWRAFCDHPKTRQPVPPRALIGLANAERHNNDPAAALQTIERAAEHYPKRADVRELLAEIATQQEDWPKAEDAWTSCISQFPAKTKPKWYLDLAEALKEQGKYDAVLAHMETATERFPNVVALRLLLAQELLRAGRDSEAWTLVDEAKATSGGMNKKNTNLYVDLLLDTNQVARLKSESAADIFSDERAKNATKAVSFLIRAGELESAQNILADTFDKRLNAGVYKRLLSQVSAAFDASDRKAWFQKIADHAGEQAKTATGSDRKALQIAQLNALYGVEDLEAFGALAQELHSTDPEVGQRYVDVHERLLGRSESRIKIFGIGLSKTATTSLAYALDHLGFLTADFVNPFSRELLQERELRIFDALTDTPITCQFEDLYARHPEAYFIYTSRPIDSWESSFETYFRRNLDLKEFGELDEIINKKPVKYGDAYRQIFNTLYVPYATPEEAYKAHEARVFSFFEAHPDANFLHLDIFAGEGYEKLGSFLGVDAPSEPFPKENVNSDHDF